VFNLTPRLLEGWVSSRVGLDVLEKRKIDSNPGQSGLLKIPYKLGY